MVYSVLLTHHICNIFINFYLHIALSSTIIMRRGFLFIPFLIFFIRCFTLLVSFFALFIPSIIPYLTLFVQFLALFIPSLILFILSLTLFVTFLTYWKQFDNKGLNYFNLINNKLIKKKVLKPKSCKSLHIKMLHFYWQNLYLNKKISNITFNKCNHLKYFISFMKYKFLFFFLKKSYT